MCGSFIAVCRETRIGVYEFYNPAIIPLINHEKYEVMDALRYLQELNRSIRLNIVSDLAV